MPLNEFSESLKAKLYDWSYTPFMSSFIISWVIYNYKFVYLFTSSIEAERKLRLLTYYSFGDNYQDLWIPAIIALLYVFIYPIFFNFFYSITLLYKKLNLWIRTKIEDENPLPKKEAKTIKADNVRLMLENEKKDETISKFETHYENKLNYKIQSMNTENVNLNMNLESTKEDLEKSKKVFADLHRDYTKLKQNLDNKNAEIIAISGDLKKLSEYKDNITEYTLEIKELTNNNHDLKNRIKDLTNELNEINKYKKQYEENNNKNNARTKIMKLIYEISNTFPIGYMDLVTEAKNILTEKKEIDIEAILDGLITEKIIAIDPYSTCSITTNGKKILVEMFSN